MVVVEPGTVVVTADRTAIMRSTPIGSGIVVALVDVHVPVCGMVHFLLPDSSLHHETSVYRPELFANTGFELLLNQVEQMGVLREGLRAYLVGGADPMRGDDLDSQFALGARNVGAIELLVASSRVRLAAARVGGNCGRRIAVELATGKVRISETPSRRKNRDLSG